MCAILNGVKETFLPERGKLVIQCVHDCVQDRMILRQHPHTLLRQNVTIILFEHQLFLLLSYCVLSYTLTLITGIQV